MVPYLHQYLAVVRKIHFLGANWNKFPLFSNIIHAGTTPSKGAIWNELSEQHQHQRIKKVPNKQCFGAKKGADSMHILVGIETCLKAEKVAFLKLKILYLLNFK